MKQYVKLFENFLNKGKYNIGDETPDGNFIVIDLKTLLSEIDKSELTITVNASDYFQYKTAANWLHYEIRSSDNRHFELFCKEHNSTLDVYTSQISDILKEHDYGAYYEMYVINFKSSNDLKEVIIKRKK